MAHYLCRTITSRFQYFFFEVAKFGEKTRRCLILHLDLLFSVPVIFLENAAMLLS